MDNLRLRRFHDDDFTAFHASMSAYDVVKMTGAWPWPPAPAFTRSRMETPHAKDGRLSVIDFDGQYIGQVSLVDGELGYMPAKLHWGQGIASWAVAKKVRQMFESADIADITAAVWHDNPASEKVLLKNGFCQTGVGLDYCKARNETLQNNVFSLNRSDWLALRA